MSSRNRRSTTSNSMEELFLVLGGIALLGAAVIGPWLALTIAARLDGSTPPPKDPIATALGLWVDHTLRWTATATAVAVAAGVFLLTLLALIAWPFVAKGRGRFAVDRQARYMASKTDVSKLTEKQVRAKATRLGVEPFLAHGLPLGRFVPTGTRLWSSWEDMLVLIAGPRTNKTTAYVIPWTIAAPGACVTTSNKRDALDATRGVREQVGAVWVFDPQGVAREEPTWWWNPLSYVTDETRAEKLAAQFAASSRAPGARTDAYFDSEGENLIGLLLLAAACGGYPITMVYRWLTRPTDQEPVRILEAHDYALQSESMFAFTTLPDKQREGVYGTARALMSWVRSKKIAAWVTPAGSRPEFHPDVFARSTDTLYLLSREGEGSAGPLVAALTVAVTDAAEDYATASRGGRLAVPMVLVLDEAANICKFKNLDSLYSHYGSRGIIIATVLQSYVQGEEVWGQGGMEKLWSAANVKVYGGSDDEDRFLRRLSDLIGTYDMVLTGDSTQRGGRSRSRSIHTDRSTLSVADLRELPAGRAVVFTAGVPAFLMKPEPWFSRKDKQAEQITASLARYQPAATRTDDDAPPVSRDSVPTTTAQDSWVSSARAVTAHRVGDTQEMPVIAPAQQAALDAWQVPAAPAGATRAPDEPSSTDVSAWQVGPEQ